MPAAATGQMTADSTVAATAIAAGDADACAIVGDTTMQCWGDNYYYQLGDLTNHDRSTPVAVTGLTGATALDSGYEATCAVTDGHVYCWGTNQFGLLGDGTSHDRPTPGPVSGITTATGVSVGFYHACAVLSGGPQVGG